MIILLATWFKKDQTYQHFSSACKISFRISSAYSNPTEIRIRPGVIFTSNLSSSVSLPCVVPQIIVLYWSWDKYTPALNFNKAIEENFPANKLKEMIDK